MKPGEIIQRVTKKEDLKQRLFEEMLEVVAAELGADEKTLLELGRIVVVTEVMQRRILDMGTVFRAIKVVEPPPLKGEKLAGTVTEIDFGGELTETGFYIGYLSELEDVQLEDPEAIIEDK